MNEFHEGDYVIYALCEDEYHRPIKPGTFQIGLIKRIVDDGAFVWYHEGDTASKTPFVMMHKLENAYVIGETSLGGRMT